MATSTYRIRFNHSFKELGEVAEAVLEHDTNTLRGKVYEIPGNDHYVVFDAPTEEGVDELVLAAFSAEITRPHFLPLAV
jgi:transcriptional regulator of NAD metabolism